MMHKQLPAALLALVICPGLTQAQSTVATIAGGGPLQITGIGGPATGVQLGGVGGVATDTQGNVYASNAAIYKISPSGILTVAVPPPPNWSPSVNIGAFRASFALDSAHNIYKILVLRSPTDPNGYISCTVVRTDPAGTQTTVAGSGTCGYSGDGGPATLAGLGLPTGIALDAAGNLYITDVSTNRVRKVDTRGVITTVAGNGKCCFTGDGVQAASTPLNSPQALTVDANGLLYIADVGNERIRRVGADGIITTIAGGNGQGFSGDEGPALQAQFNGPAGLTIQSDGTMWIADEANHRVRKITPDGIVHTVAGSGTANFTGDRGPAAQATLDAPMSVAVDLAGNLYIADSGNSRIRRVDNSGVITTFAGDGNYSATGDGGPALQAALGSPRKLIVDGAGNTYFSDVLRNTVRKIDPNGVITTVVGGLAPGFAGDGGPATKALLRAPEGLAMDAAGNLYIADNGNLRVRKVDIHGTISTFAGNGLQAGLYGVKPGDGGPAADASFGSLLDVAVDGNGNVYVAGYSSSRRISADGTITTVASPANALSTDPHGSIYASYKSLSPFPTPSGTGGQVNLLSPDGASATEITTFTGYPGKLAFDSQGNFYMSETKSISRLDLSRVKTTVAGTLDKFNGPQDVALDPAGNIIIADTQNNLIRKLFLNPASGVIQPSMQMILQPGYYIAAVTLGQGEQPGYWGMEILTGGVRLDGGLNLGGAIQQRSLPPGFGGVYLPVAESLHVHVDSQAAVPGSVQLISLGVQLLDSSGRLLIPEQTGGASVDFTQSLPAGYYVIAVRGGGTSPRQNFQMSLSAPYLTGGADAGGFVAPDSVGFGAFYISAPIQVSIQVFAQPTYGANGSGALRLTLYDANRKVISSVP